MELMSLKSVFLLLQMCLILSPRGMSQGIRRSAGRSKQQVEDDSNSPALNNFLENVLRAKDELKSIDRTINSDSYRTRSNKRRLLWSTHSQHRRHAAIRDHDSDKDADGIGDRSAANEVDIETILGDLGFSGESSPARNLGKNVRVERRRYPISDLTGSGIIEYYDYEGDVGKRDSQDNTNASGIAEITSTSVHMEAVKKDETTMMIENTTESSTLAYPKQQFLSDEVRPSSEDKKFIVDIDDQASENREDRDMEIANELDGDAVGREARCHRDEENRENGMLFHSHYLEIQEYEIIPKTNGPSEHSIRSPKAINPEKTFFIISPVNSPEENNSSSTSGSDYHALKVTDDMFKGGIEQGNSMEDSPNIYFPNMNEIQNDKHWKSLQEGSQKPKNSDNLQLIRNGKSPFEIHRESINKDTLSLNKDSRTKRSSEIGPIMRHESIVEPFNNWPWQDYDSHENTMLGFGRELMQATETNTRVGELTSSKSIQPNGFSTSVTRHRDTNQNFKVFWRPRALTYLHRKSRSYIKGRQKFKKNHSTQFDTMKRVKRNTNGVARVGRLVGKIGRENSMHEDQMGLAVNGDIAGKIVDKIFEQVHKNEPLKTNLGPGLNRHSKSGQVRPEQMSETSDPVEMKRAEEIMKKVMELLGHLVSEEAHQKTCTKLPPHLHEFLVWMVGDEESRDIQGTTAPSVVHPNHQKMVNSKPEKFLFSSSQQPETQTELPSDLYRKVRLLKALIKEYHVLTEKEQTKVQAVHDYLERQLHALLKFIESKEKGKSPKSPVSQQKRSHSFAAQIYEDDDELQESPLRAKGHQRRRRRQVKKGRKKKKHKIGKHKKNKHTKKSRNQRNPHLRRKRSINPVNYLPWEVPRIFNPNLKFLSNLSSSTDDHWTMSPITWSIWRPPTKDDELKILFEGTPSNKSTGKLYKTLPPISPTTSPSTTLGAVTKIHSTELINAPNIRPNSSITAVSLTPKESPGRVNIIENKGDNSRTLNSLERRINVFPVSP